MRIVLDSAAQAEVLALPESGMGFQHVTAHHNGEKREFLVLNASHAYRLDSLDLEAAWTPAATLANGMRVMWALQDEEEGSGRLSGFALVSRRVAPPGAPPVASIALPSSLVSSYALSAPRSFRRYSPFKPDRRVNPTTGDFVAGTYAAPMSEVPFVPTGFVAVGRYALPSALPASHQYEIRAPAGTPVMFGTVSPAFGQAGGGVEAYFAGPVKNQDVPPNVLAPLDND